jgi:hypothetical protein
MYIRIKNQQGGGIDISSFSWKKAWGQTATFVKHGENQG